ncbi:MAG: cytochrome c, partial [Acidobacteriota bacterium]|nr:cytochrome c [Acidobacteriota bacterium]
MPVPLAAGALAAALTVAAVAAPAAQDQPRSVNDGVYTAAQAARGQVLYDDQCASCHGPIRAFVPEMAALLGDHTFRANWRGRPLDELFGLIRETMPQDAPGTLSPRQSAEIVAYILSGNRKPAGETPLADDP